MIRLTNQAHPTNPPHPEVPASAGLEGGLQKALRELEPSFEAASRHLRMRVWVGGNVVEGRLRLAMTERRYQRPRAMSAASRPTTGARLLKPSDRSRSASPRLIVPTSPGPS